MVDRTRVPGIETAFAGTLFRSRLEAKWAAFMTRIAWDWTYEPFDANGYIPDFSVSGSRPLLVEVKPAVSVYELAAHTERLESALRGHWAHDILIVGVAPIIPTQGDGGWSGWFPTAGVLGEWIDPPSWGDEGEPVWAWAEANWLRCGKCGMAVVCHSEQSYGGRPCGHHDGDHYMGDPDKQLLADAWAIATNVTRWRKKVT